MASNVEMKVIKFLFENEEFRYKFPSNDSTTSIIAALRRRFNIKNDIDYDLVDIEDNTTISLSCLLYLKNDTSILVKLNNSNLETNISKNDSNSSSSSQIVGTLDSDSKRMPLSFSDNNVRLLTSDLSSISVSSDSDYKTNIHYNSAVPISGATKQCNARTEKNKREFKILCNKKIIRFLETHANVTPVDCHRVVRQILKILNIQLLELYNLLKFVRNKMNVQLLNLNKQNVVDVIVNVYKNNYVNDNSKDDNDIAHNSQRRLSISS
ncbi:unnamed protein product [Rotaria socialis]|uniref:Uncharacterized protein n=1 Tax=Rotaria socialis TaxID=392032 RepID=A0A818KHM5_9BILA|nr:unnamed protein product [Rotaria socialis]CAF4639743.1 unnamed protein product [Rotaria socialis]